MFGTLVLSLLFLWLCVSTLCVGSTLAGSLESDGTPGISNVTVNADKIPRYEKFEVSFELSGTWSNPFDPDEVTVDGIFRTPNGRTMTMPGFYFRDYQRTFRDGREILTPISRPVWKIRFSPTMPGTYRYTLRMVNDGQTVQTEERTFHCTDNSNKHGFLRISAENPYYFQFEDGTPFFVVGENIATLGSMGTAQADKWYTSFARVGGNFARLWWCAGGTDLESRVSDHPDQGLGRYKLDEAWRIDYLVNLADRSDIHLMCCLETQQYLRKGVWWERFTYNKANGGPVESPADYFVNDEADAYFRKRLRYIVARWSYSTAIFSWQFWNEVNACNDFNPGNAARWHERMAQYLRSIDPYDHLIHTNFGNLDGYEEVDSLPEMEVISTNIYSRRDMGQTAAWAARMMAQRYRKPYLLTEYGVGHHGGWVADDPKGIIVHNGLWGALMNGSAGTALPWGWGNWVDEQNMYHYWQVVSDVVQDTPFHQQQWKPITVEKLIYQDDTKPPYYARVFFEGWPRNYAYKLSPTPRPNTFRISADGKVDKPESLNAMLRSNESQAFSIDFPVDGTFVVHVPEISSRDKPILHVAIDGQEVFRQDLLQDTEYPWQYWKSYAIPMTAGRHQIEVSNVGTGGLWTGNLWTAYELQNYRHREGPDLDVMGMETDDTILLWVRNPQFIWIYDREGRTLEEQDEGLLTLRNVSEGEYSVVWRETTTGEVLARRVATTDGDRLTLTTPRITRSAVAKLVKLSP